MRRRMLVLGLVIVGLMHAQAATAASITFKSQNVALNACPTPDCAFDVELVAEGFEPLLGLVLNFSFNPAVATLNSIAQGEFLAAGGLGGFDASPLPGESFQTITKFVDPSSAAIEGSGVLATLKFTPTITTTGSLALTLLLEALRVDGSTVNTEYITVDGQVLAPDLVSGVINVQNPQPVPEPSTLALLGVGLAAVARKRLKRKPLG